MGTLGRFGRSTGDDRRLLQNILRALILVLFIGPLAGLLCGLLDASVGMIVMTLYAGEPEALLMALYMGFTFALAFGIPTGFFFMLLVVWPIRNDNLFVALLHLAGGTLLFALPVACIPNGVAISFFTGMLGFWVGFTRLKIRNFTKEDWRRFVFGESGYGW